MEALKPNQSGVSPPLGSSSNPDQPVSNKLVANLRGETSDKKRGKSLSLTKNPSSKVDKKLEKEKHKEEKAPHKIDSKPSLTEKSSKASPLTPQPSNAKSEVNFPLGAMSQVARVNLFGAHDVKNEIFTFLTGQKEPQQCLTPLVTDSVAFNLWNYDLPLDNTAPNKFFLNSGFNVIAFKVHFWKSTLNHWISVSRTHSNANLPVLVIGMVYTSGGLIKKLPIAQRKVDLEQCEKNILKYYHTSKVKKVLFLSADAKPEKKQELTLKAIASLFEIGKYHFDSTFPPILPIFPCILENFHLHLKPKELMSYAEFEKSLSLFVAHMDTKKAFTNLSIPNLVNAMVKYGVCMRVEISTQDIIILDPGVFLKIQNTIHSFQKELVYLSDTLIPKEELNAMLSKQFDKQRLPLVECIIVYFEMVYPCNFDLPIASTEINAPRSTDNWIRPPIFKQKTELREIELKHEKNRIKFHGGLYSRHFTIWSYAPYSLFERIYVSLFSLFPNNVFDPQSFSWNSFTHSGVYLFHSHSKTKLLVKYIKNVLSVESNEKLQFCRALLAIRDVLKSCYKSLEYVEFVNCSCNYEIVKVSAFAQSFFEGEQVLCDKTKAQLTVKEFCPEFYFPYAQIMEGIVCDDELLGEGAFGIVKKGYLPNGTAVALKAIKSTDDEELLTAKILEVQREVDIMITFPTNSPYLLRSYGIQLPCTIVIEFAPLGVLGDFLYKNINDTFPELLRCKICHDVAMGMKVLHDFRPPIIHRDLRSFNVFIMTMNQDPSLVNAKVGDFGLSIASRNMCSEILPTWQWLAPEVFGSGEYNHKSDVYSYGIVVYEIFARILPYTDMTEYISVKEFALSAEDLANQAKIAMLLDTGYTVKGNKAYIEEFKVQSIKNDIVQKRLSPNIPASWSPILANLLRDCWNYTFALRPEFSTILQTISELTNYFFQQQTPINLEIQIPTSTRESVYKRRGTILMVDAEAANVLSTILDGEDPRKRKKSMTSKRKPIPQFSNAPSLQSSREHKISRGSNVSIMNSFKASRMASERIVSIPKEIDVEGHAGFGPEHELEIMFDMEASQLEFNTRDDSDEFSGDADDGMQPSSPGGNNHVRELPHHVPTSQKYYNNYYDGSEPGPYNYSKGRSPLARSADEHEDDEYNLRGVNHSYLHNNSNSQSNSRDNSGSYNAYSGEERDGERRELPSVVTVTRVPQSPTRSNTDEGATMVYHGGRDRSEHQQHIKNNLTMSSVNFQTPHSLPNNASPNPLVRSKRGMSASVVESNKINSSSSSSLDRERDRAERERERSERALASLSGGSGSDGHGSAGSRDNSNSNNANHSGNGTNQAPEKLIKVSSLKSSSPDFNQLVNRAAVLQSKRNDLLAKYNTAGASAMGGQHSSMNASNSSVSNSVNNSGSSLNNNGASSNSNSSGASVNNSSSPHPVHINVSSTPPINVAGLPKESATNLALKAPMRRPSSVDSVHSPRSNETLSGSNDHLFQPLLSPRSANTSSKMSISPSAFSGNLSSGSPHDMSTSPSNFNSRHLQRQDSGTHSSSPHSGATLDNQQANEDASSSPEQTQLSALLTRNLDDLVEEAGLYQNRHTVIRDWFISKSDQIVLKLNAVFARLAQVTQISILKVALFQLKQLKEISRESFDSVLPNKVWPIPNSTGGLVEKLISTFEVLISCFCENMEDLKVWAASNTDARVFLAMAKKLKEFDEKVDELALIGVSSK